MCVAWMDERRRNPGSFCEPLCEMRGECLALSGQVIEAGDLDTSDRRDELCHAIVATKNRASIVLGHLIYYRFPVIATELRALCCARAVGHEHAALACLHCLVDVEAKNTYVADGARKFPLPFRAGRLRVVFNELEFALFGYLQKLGEIRGLPIEINDHDRLRVFCDAPPNGLGVDTKRALVDIRKYRHGAIRKNCGSRSRHRIWRHDHLIARSALERDTGGMQRRGRRIDGHRMLHFELFCE